MFYEFVLIYCVLAIMYLWYRYILLFYETKYSKIYKWRRPRLKASIIVPVYNEDPAILDMVIENALKTKCEVIVVDDGSKIDYYDIIKKYIKNKNFKYIKQENRGKRHAQATGFKIASGDILVTVDSDTILTKNSIKELLKAFRDPKVGAATGNIFVANRNKNLLTKLIASRYFLAFNIERKGLSNFGVVNCCSGPLSAYRKELVLKVLDRYVNQTFLGRRCTFGDDRHLTNLILMQGYDVVFVDTAVAFTFVPENLKKFLKQQTRWKKSWLRENYILSKFMLKRSKLLTIETIYTIFLNFSALIIRIALWISIFFYPLYIIDFLIIIGVMAVLRNLYTFFYDKNKFFYGIIYGYLHEFFVEWTLVAALITIRNMGWGTR